MPGIEVSVELATLLGRNDHPASFPGLGPVLAHTARRVVANRHRATWLFTIVDDHGAFLWGGLTRRRPLRDHQHRSPPRTAGGIVALIIPAALLEELAGDPGAAGRWAPLIADIHPLYKDRH